MTFDDYDIKAKATAIYPHSGYDTRTEKLIGLMYCTIKLNGEAGEFAEGVGKAMRDDDFERRNKLILELGDILWYVAAAARELGSDLDTVAFMNLSKLQSRKERGQLQGSGDLR